MRLVSACLLGVNCNFEGKSWANLKALEGFAKGDLFPVCPEVLGGLPVPRVPAEIQNGTGAEVIGGTAKVINEKGADVTNEFLKDAYETLRIAKTLKIKEAILIEKSPSCDCGKIFDGTFSNRFINGDGVTTVLLKKNGIKVTSIEVP